MTSSHPLPAPCPCFARLARALDRRSAPRLALLFLGAVPARGRGPVIRWIRAAGLSSQFQPCYTAVAAAGKEAEAIAAHLVLTVVKPLLDGVERLTLALDDTPTQRYGPHVQGAGVHHNPTPGPAGSPYVYGHVFVVLGLLYSRGLRRRKFGRRTVCSTWPHDVHGFSQRTENKERVRKTANRPK